MWLLILIPFVVQAAATFLDEGIFHIKRGLPRWERIGHPLDTLSVLACFLFALLVPYSSLALKIYIGLALFSCLLVTKDEFVHKHHCPASEQWLHALLFLNHPVVLTGAGLMWPVIHGAGPSWLLGWLTHPEFLRLFLVGQAVMAFLFFLYQVIYWNFIWKPQE